MKAFRKLTALLLSFVIAFSCMALSVVQSSAASVSSIISVTVVKKPTKLKYTQGTDWDYGFYDFPEECEYGTFCTSGGNMTFTMNSMTYKKISFHHNGGYYTDQYFDRGMLDLNGLVISVLYSDFTEETITFKETKSGNVVHQNIYANPASGEFFVGTNKINVYVPGNSKIKASFDIELVESDSYSLGDVNMDKKINSSDALLILQSVVNLKTLTTAQKALADVNSDLRINSSDALQILKITVGD